MHLFLWFERHRRLFPPLSSLLVPLSSLLYPLWVSYEDDDDDEDEDEDEDDDADDDDDDDDGHDDDDDDSSRQARISEGSDAEGGPSTGRSRRGGRNV